MLGRKEFENFRLIESLVVISILMLLRYTHVANCCLFDKGTTELVSRFTNSDPSASHWLVSFDWGTGCLGVRSDD